MLSCVKIKEMCGVNIPKSKPHFFPRIREKKKKLQFLWAIVGYKNLIKAPVPRVISMAEEFIVKPRRPPAWTVRPH